MIFFMASFPFLAKCLIIGLTVFLYISPSIIYLLSSTMRILNLAESFKVVIEVDDSFETYLIIRLTLFFYFILSSNLLIFAEKFFMLASFFNEFYFKS